MLRNNKINNPRLLIAKLREGDYAHAGEEEAIDIVFKGVEQLLGLDSLKTGVSGAKLKAIDIGCGLGGTANYIKETTDFDIYGIDIDGTAIEHAKNRYKNIRFFQSDVMEITKIIEPNYFDLIYLFNSFYAFSDQARALKLLSQITKPGGLLVIFDYSFKSKTHDTNMVDLAGKPMNPIIVDEFEAILNSAGWDLISVVDLQDKYEQWYEIFLNKLSNNKSLLLQEFTEEVYKKVEDTFNSLLKDIRNKILGGSVFYAKHKMG